MEIENTIKVIPTEAIGSIEELKTALAAAYYKMPHKNNMNHVLNKQRAKQNKVAKRRAKKK
jgi:hypothetical protein